MIKHKRAEWTAKQIGVVILLIAAFCIVLFLYYQFNWKGTMNKQTCHNSVVLRATSPTFQGSKVLEVPLRCETNKICIAKEKQQRCSSAYGDKTQVDTRVVKNQMDVKRIVADAIFDCWAMMGEGKLDVFSREFTLKGYSVSCVECAKIAFDDSIKNDSKFDYITQFVNYLFTERVQGADINYSEYLFGNKEPPRQNNIGAIDQFTTNKSYSIIFVEYDRTTLPEYVGGVLSNVIGHGLLAYFTGGSAYKYLGISGTAVLTGTLWWAGSELGGLMGSFIGDKYVAAWMFYPTTKSGSYSAKSIDIGTLKKFGVAPNKNYCYAKNNSENLYYSLKYNDKLLYSSDNIDDLEKNKIDINSQTLGQADKDKYSAIASELYIACYDISKISCTWESYA